MILGLGKLKQFFSFYKSNYKKHSVLTILLTVKIIFSLLVCFVGFTHPHIHRQSATLAVNQRFAIDWKFNDKELPFLPRSLAGGDQDAILETEFPLFNYVTMPAFLFPLDTDQARILGRLLGLLFVFGLWIFHYLVWRDLKILDISGDLPSLLLILLPISGIYFHRFMPDFTSFILCSLALGVSLKNPRQIFLPLILACLGLLVKPTGVISFAPLLLLQNPLKEMVSRLTWLLPSSLTMLFYYSVGTKWIRSHSDLDRYYLTDFRDPIKSFIEFFSQPTEATKLFIEKISVPYLPILILIFWLIKPRRPEKKGLMLWSVLILQFVAIAVLDGSHAFVHDYYFIGLSLNAAFIWSYYFSHHADSKLKKVLLFLPLILFNLERGFYELRDFAKPRPQSVTSHWQACKALKNRNPDVPWNQGHSFQSILLPIPEIAVCFGEIQSSKKSPFGFFYTFEPFPQNCIIKDQEGELILAKCSPQSAE